MFATSQLIVVALASLITLVKANLALPGKIYGVNLGSWLLIEPWMLPQEWLNMGGERCDDCSKCIASEFEFSKAYGRAGDKIFDHHWSTWFTADDVSELKSLGINTVRVPLGYWIVEQLVDRKTEFYPRGGLRQLRRGLQQLYDAGITAILDHHALPGVQVPNQMFTGRCTQDVEFYTDYNYHRALIWTAVMTALSHLDPAFKAVAAIQAVNEPIMNATLTPGYGEFQKKFVATVRAVELTLGIPTNGYTFSSLNIMGTDMSASLAVVAKLDVFAEVASVLSDALPIILELGLLVGFPAKPSAKPLVTNFMDVNWQYNNPSNPADAADGPQAYDNHLYYSFGGVADPNEEAYLTHVCNLDRIQKDAALGDSPLWFGEWGLPTQFNATDEFLVKWGDAQRYAYSQSRGWIFWNFKVEKSDLAGDLARQWSYVEGVRLGYLTKDPSKLHDPDVCKP